jgi:hypothetical protein
MNVSICLKCLLFFEQECVRATGAGSEINLEKKYTRVVSK